MGAGPVYRLLGRRDLGTSEFPPQETALIDGDTPRTVKVRAQASDGRTTEFDARVRIDTPNEWLYYRHDGILHYVLRRLAS